MLERLRSRGRTNSVCHLGGPKGDKEQYTHPKLLSSLLDETRVHSHEDNVAMANAIIDIGLSGRTHQEQTEDLQEWVNTYAWAATDDSTCNEEKKQQENAEESELDDDTKANS